MSTTKKPAKVAKKVAAKTAKRPAPGKPETAIAKKRFTLSFKFLNEKLPAFIKANSRKIVGATPAEVIKGFLDYANAQSKK